jgi:23S rRNA pseudouridine955/2504/2580 synthase
VWRLTIEEDLEGVRISSFLKQHLHLPYSLLHKLLRKGKVRAHGEPVPVDYRLQAGDRITVDLPGASPVRPTSGSGTEGPEAEERRGKSEDPKKIPAARQKKLPAAEQKKILQAIVYEDADLLVLEKPAGIVVHGGSGHTFSILDVLFRHLKVDPADPCRPAFVHRLDKDTSGLLVLAKRRPVLRDLTAALREGRLKKTYLALVKGEPEEPEGAIATGLKKSGKPGRERMRATRMSEGKASATFYRVLEGFGKASLLEVRPETGRRHQIRAHLASIGHPPAGDRKYGDPYFNRHLAREVGLKRLFLHASKLEIPSDVLGQGLRLRSPLPPDLKGVLLSLRRRK